MYQIVGIKRLDYISKKTGKHVKGTNLYLSFEDEGIEGTGVKEVYCNALVETDGLAVGDQIDLYYNEYGKVSAIGVQSTIDN